MKKATILTALLALASGLVPGSLGLVFAQEDQNRVVATVNDAKITSGDITKKLWWQYSAQGLSEIIDEKLLLEEAARLNTGYDAKEAGKRFENLSAGYKDKKQFETNLKAVGWTPDDLKDLIKHQLQIKNAIIAVKKIDVTDVDVKAFFEQNKDKLGKAETARLRQIFVATKADADEVYQILAAGADFAKLSGLKSIEENLKKKDGDIGDISKGLLLPEIEKDVFALKPGQYTKPIVTGNGYSIFKMESFKPGEPAKLTDALKADLKTAMVNQAVTKALPELTAELRQKAKIELIR
jgi:parvulin-like peptidyl-prolyl isomerase